MPWRRLRELLVLLIVLMVTVKAMQYLGMFDVGSGNATAKDGDSLTLNDTEVRLFGIDAPELHQTCGSPDGEYPCGREARTALRDLLAGQTISCTSHEADRYGRAVSVCRAGETEINREMVRRGWAVAYVRHSTRYLREEREAQAANRGIWRGRFEMPENYRERTRLEQGAMTSQPADD
ncbi:MAG: thermonuclease family protein [Proteobacteria bacterium]|nr:thermonuclease family protein [Pseudomonadota bacterium]